VVGSGEGANECDGAGEPDGENDGYGVVQTVELDSEKKTRNDN
jgi:hypothetical protein